MNAHTHRSMRSACICKSSVPLQSRLCKSGLEQVSEQWTNEVDPRHAPTGSGAAMKSHVWQVSPRNAPAVSGAVMKSHVRISGGGETEKGIGERQSILVSEHTRNTQNEGAMVIPTMQRRFLQPCNAFQATAVNYCDNNAPRRLTSRLARGDRTLRSRASVMSAY